MTLINSADQKTISVCIIGKPNAGKSSLLNHVIGQKISIVTPKVQTTRSQITGIVTIKETQIIMFDTPGIFEPKKQLERAMVRCAWSSLHGADIVLLIIDNLESFGLPMINIFKKLRSLNIQPVFLLNKIDVEHKQKHQNEIELLEYFDNPQIFKISALLGSGVNELMKYLCDKAINSPWQYDQDDITTSPIRFLAAEITRERLFLNLHEELPYNLTVQTEKWEEKNDALYIHQAIVVARENHKMMVLGKHGIKIKEISSMARLEMEKCFDKKVHLFVFVKVRELWENMPEFYHDMGLKFESLSNK